MTSFFKRPYTRWTQMVAVLSSSMFHAARADYEAEILSENPVVYYRFDDGVTVDDLDTAVGVNLGSLGTAGNGSFIGTPIRGVPGAIAGNTAMSSTQPTATSINFIGAMSTPNNPALNPSHTGTNPFSVECWVKPNTNTSTLLSPFNSMSFTTGRAGYLIYQNGSTWQLRIGNKASATAALTLNGGTVVAGTWQHIAFTYTGGKNGTAILYVDGVPVATGVPTGIGYEANDNAPFLIGATSNLARTFDGTVDEVAYTPAVLTEARIDARIAERTTNPAGYQAHVLADAPVGYWRLSEAPFVPRTPPVATNAGSLGTATNGAYYAGSKNSATGPSPSSGFLGFSASNSSLGLAAANGHVGTPFQLNSLISYTVMGWVKRSAVKSTRGGYFGQNDKLEFGDAGGGTQIEAWSGGGGLLAPFAAADDQWTFITYVADGSSNRLYVDGVQVSSAAGGVGGSSDFNFNIGGGGIFGPTGDYFRGEIDEVAVFDKALTPGRVRELFDAARGNVAADLTVTNVRAGQKPGTKQVEIYYDMRGNTSPVHVSLQVSSNGGTTFAVLATALSGDVGANIPLGTNKRIVWNAGVDWNNQLSNTMRFRVTASDTPPPPDGFALIPAGSFAMGRTSGDTDIEAPPVNVYVSGFYMARYEVTKELWDAVRASAVNNGYTDLRVGGGKGPRHPVHTVSWWDVVKWCNARSEMDGLVPVYRNSNGTVFKTGTTVPTPNWSANGYRLPTEAEWEKAARGGVSGLRFPWGDTIDHSQANYQVYSPNGTTNYYSYDVTPRPPANGKNYFHPTYNDGVYTYTSPVGSFTPNGYGLFDMAGNVLEWNWDWYSGLTYVNGASDPKGASSGTGRVYRGGSWGYLASNCRAAHREAYDPGNSGYNSHGFRIARSSVP